MEFAICASIVALTVAWISIEDLIWGRRRRMEILAQLSLGPKLGRDLARGRSTRYVLLHKMWKDGLIEVEDLLRDLREDAPYRYQITDLGHAWLRAETRREASANVS